MRISHILIAALLFVSSCGANASKPAPAAAAAAPAGDTVRPIMVAAEDTAAYLPMLRGKKVAITANPTSQAFGRHLLDLLLESGIDVDRVFAPEHGFRGSAEPGAKVDTELDSKTGIRIISLFGSNLKPSPAQMAGLDCVVYDIQDVGCRFFTYISTLHNIMEAAAECGVSVIVLDRPNPNIDCVAGPVREDALKSFVSMDPIPIVYGMTVGELANMINEEGWLNGKAKCRLTVVPVRNYSRDMRYELPVRPSPNLPDYLSVRMYPSLCLFEATNISVGRGTQRPFTAIGFPDEKYGQYVFTPEDIPGMQTDPLHEGKRCHGISFDSVNPDTAHFTLKYLIDMYRISGGTCITRNHWLSLLYGNKELPKMLAGGASEEEIAKSWEPGLSKFKERRRLYLIYH